MREWKRDRKKIVMGKWRGKQKTAEDKFRFSNFRRFIIRWIAGITMCFFFMLAFVACFFMAASDMHTEYHYHFRYSSNTRPRVVSFSFGEFWQNLPKNYNLWSVHTLKKKDRKNEKEMRQKANHQSMKPQIAIWSHGLLIRPQIYAPVLYTKQFTPIQSMRIICVCVCMYHDSPRKIWKISGKCWMWPI